MGWKEELYSYELNESQDLDELADSSTEMQNNDLGIINPVSGAGIVTRENGNVEAFADYGLGFRFSRDAQSLMVFAPSVHIFSTDIQKHDQVAMNTFLRDEYNDIDSILSQVTVNGTEEGE